MAEGIASAWLHGRWRRSSRAGPFSSARFRDARRYFMITLAFAQMVYYVAVGLQSATAADE
jgi:hypothetical protein